MAKIAFYSEGNRTIINGKGVGLDFVVTDTTLTLINKIDISEIWEGIFSDFEDKDALPIGTNKAEVLEYCGLNTGFKPAAGGSAALVKAFETRVLADTGTFEGKTNLLSFTQTNWSIIKNASLVLTPNGYKNSKLFAMVPSDGSGDMTWTRASDKTRVNESGLVETLPYNRLGYSEEFSNISWTKTNATITANAITAPDGTLTADSLIEDSTSATHIVRKDLSLNSDKSNAFLYVKAKTGSVRNVGILFNSTSKGVLVNPSSGTVVSYLGLTASDVTIEALPDGWFKISIVVSHAQITENFRIYLGNGTTWTSAYLGDGVSGVHIWGAQSTAGSTVKPYLKTTDRLNIPSIDYSSGTGAILVEPQATNLVTYSRDFENVAWSKTDLTVSGKKLIPTAVSNLHLIRKNSTTTTAGKQTMSVIAKADGYNFIRFWEDASTGKQCYFDLINGTATNVTMDSCSIIPLGDGYYKCIGVVTVGAASSFGFRINVTPDGSLTPFVGDGIKGVLIDYAQMETGGAATSYIPTVASTVTRVADLVVKNGISALIGQTEGTIVCKFNYYQPNRDAYILDVFDSLGTLNQRNFAIWLNTSNFVIVQVNNSGSQVSSSLGIPSLGVHTVAITYKLNEVKLYLDGVLLVTDTSCTIPVTDSYRLGARSDGAIPYGNTIENVMLFETILTDLQIQSLT